MWFGQAGLVRNLTLMSTSDMTQVSHRICGITITLEHSHILDQYNPFPVRKTITGKKKTDSVDFGH